MARVKKAIFKFQPFSLKQKKVLTWWFPESPVHDSDGIIADGAIRSGKTLSMSLSFVIWAMTSFDLQNFGMCGKTIGSFRRNVLFWLKLMLRSRGYKVQDKRADNLVIVSRNDTVNYFYIFGGKDEKSQDLIQGITLAGVFFDEVALMPESFVNQATGRCSVDGSKFWFNCNPAGPFHWFKVNWIDKAAELNILYLHFTMDDNLSLSDEVKERYRRMYTGVFFKRYILGLWVAAEGLIYGLFAEQTDSFIIDKVPDNLMLISIGVDFGANGSAHAFVANGITQNMQEVISLDEHYRKEVITPRQLDADFVKFIKRVNQDYPKIRMLEVNCDSEATVLIQGLKVAAVENKLPVDIRNALKGPITDRISFYNSIQAQGRYKVMRKCKHLIEAYQQAVWDPKKKTEDIRLDDGTVNIDSLDACEYSTERYQRDIQQMALYKTQPREVRM